MRKSVLKGMSWSFAEKALPQALGFVTSVILARILGPSEYRAVAVVMIFINLCDVIVTSGFGLALIQKRNVDMLDYSTMSIFSVSIAIILMITIFVVSPAIECFFEIQYLAIYLISMSFRIPFAALSSIQRAFLQKRMEFKKIFFTTFIGTFIAGCVGLVMAWSGFGTWALISQYLTNSIVSTLTLFFIAGLPFRLRFSWKRCVPMIQFGWKLVLSALISKLFDESRAVILDKEFPDNSISFYNKGVQIPNIVVSTVNASITTVMYPVMASVQNDLSQLIAMMRKSLRLSTYIIVPMMMGLMMVSDSLVRVLFSDAWIETVPYMQVFSLSYAFLPIIELNQRAVQAIGKSEAVMAIEILNKIFGVISIVGALMLFDTPFYIAGSFGIYMLFSLITAMVAYGGILKYPIWKQLLDIKSSLILSITMCCVIYPLKFVLHTPIILLFSQVVFGATIYIVCSKLSKLPEFLFFQKHIISLVNGFSLLSKNNIFHEELGG